MNKYYFTFGMNSEYHNRFVVIESDSYSDARIEMFNKFGRNWAFQYTEDEWIILRRSDPDFLEECEMYGVNPDSVGESGISQEEMFNLTRLE